MNDAIDTLDDLLDLAVGEVGGDEFLVPEIGGRLEVAEPQIRIDRLQQLAQAVPMSPAAPVNRMRAISSLPSLRPICGGWLTMIANQSARKRNSNENSKCPKHPPRAGWQPATRYPDAAIVALDPRFEIWLKLSASNG